MQHLLQITSLLFLIAGLINCSPAKPPVEDSFSWEKASLHFNGHALEVEVADTPRKMSRGLMFRQDLPENQGMLFIFQRERQASFWMKNTFIPLSIAYLDQAGTILEIYPLEPLDEVPVSSRSYRVSYALEMQRGWFKERDIRPGSKVEGLPQRL